MTPALIAHFYGGLAWEQAREFTDGLALWIDGRYCGYISARRAWD